MKNWYLWFMCILSILLGYNICREADAMLIGFNAVCVILNFYAAVMSDEEE